MDYLIAPGTPKTLPFLKDPDAGSQFIATVEPPRGRRDPILAPATDPVYRRSRRPDDAAMPLRGAAQ